MLEKYIEQLRLYVLELLKKDSSGHDIIHLESNSNFLKVQQDYNKSTMDGTVDSKNEFITKNGGIDKIRKKIEYDIQSNLGAYFEDTTKGLVVDILSSVGLSPQIPQIEKEIKRVEELNPQIDKFVDFLQN